MKNLIGFIGLGFGLTYIFLLFPQGYISPFPFHEQSLSVQAYVDYLCVRVFYFLLAYIIHGMCETWQTKVIKWMFLGYILDYLLIYNDPYTRVHLSNAYFIPISYPFIMGIIFLYLYLKSDK